MHALNRALVQHAVAAAVSRVTVRTNIDRLVGGAGEETIITRVGEGMVSHHRVRDDTPEAMKHPMNKLLFEK